MARYKEYEKGDIIGSIRMDCYIGTEGEFSIKYRCIEDVRDESKVINYRYPIHAEKHMRKLGYTEY